MITPPVVWSASAAQAGPQVHLQAEAAPLSRVIARIAAQSGASIGTDDPSLLRRKLPAIRFDGPVEAALHRILQNTGLRAVRTGPLSWRIEREPIRSRPPRLPSRPTATTADAEIVVTGSKLDLALHDVPASVAILAGDGIEDSAATRGTQAIVDRHAALASTQLGPGRNKLFLRGISDSSFNGTSPVLVGQYFDDLRLTYASPDPDLRLHDIAQVEILEGPQGDLYGAGALGGLIRVVPNAPTPTAASAALWSGLSLTAHGAPGADGGFVANLPLTESAAVRALGYVEQNGGYIDDVQRGRSDVNSGTVAGGRIAAKAAFAPGWTVQATGIFQDVHNADAQYAERSVGSLARAGAVAEPSYHDFRAADLALDGRIGGARLRSTTGYVHQAFGQVFDATLPGSDPALYRQRDRIILWTSETRISDGLGDDGQWLLGTALLHAIARQDRARGTPAKLGNLGHVRSTVTEATVFGQVSFRPISPLRITAGARASRIALDGAASGALVKPVEGSNPWADRASVQWLATPSVALLWQPDRQWSIFGRYAGGYRPGGLTINAFAERFDADTIRTAELGFRFAPTDTRLPRLSGSVASSRWHDVQADAIDGQGLPHVANFGDARVESVSLELTMTPVSGLQLWAGGFLARSKLVTNPQLGDAPPRSELPNVAHYGGTGAIEYERALDARSSLKLALRANAVGPSILGVGPGLDLPQGDYAKLSAFAALTVARLTFSLEGTNLFDSRANVFALGTPFTLAAGDQRTPLRPRTIRIGVRAGY